MTGRAAAAAVGGWPGQLLLDLPGLPEPTPAPIPTGWWPPSTPGGASGPVGVYAEELVARADAAVLRRDAVGAGVRASVIDCLPVQVFTEAQHGNRPRPALG